MTKQEFCKLVEVSQPVLRKMIKNNEIEMIGPKIPAKEYYKLINPQLTQIHQETDFILGRETEERL